MHTNRIKAKVDFKNSRSKIWCLQSDFSAVGSNGRKEKHEQFYVMGRGKEKSS